MWFEIGAGLAVGCSEPPEGPSTCPETDGTTGAAGDTGGRGEGACGPVAPEPDKCAIPPAPLDPPGEVVRCQGWAEGVVLYTQNKYSSQQTAASPEDPETVPFYLDDEVGGSGGNNDEGGEPPVVRACCTSGTSGAKLGTACAYDCGRATRNRALQTVLNRAQLDDPSMGECPKRGAFADPCRENVKKSLEKWAEEILAQYGTCVKNAVSNGAVPELNLWDRDVEFAGVPLVHMECDGTPWSSEDVGCLYDAVLRVRCVVEDTQVDAAQTCDTPPNVPPDGATSGTTRALGRVLGRGA